MEGLSEGEGLGKSPGPWKSSSEGGLECSAEGSSEETATGGIRISVVGASVVGPVDDGGKLGTELGLLEGSSEGEGLGT